MPVLRTVIVEDVQEMRELLRLLLGRDGRFEVVGEAGDGESALEVVEGCQPDLVVLDIGMPRLDGLATLPRLREVAPAARIVVLSAYTAAEMARPALERGAVGYIEKRTDLSGVADELHALTAALDRVQHVLDVTYHQDVASAAAARRDLRAALAGTAEPAVLDVVELLSTELIGNAVRHAHSPARVTAALWGGRLRVSVTDEGPGLPAPVAAGHEAEGGRGLALVEALSSAWGVEPHEHAKTVWFEVPLER